MADRPIIFSAPMVRALLEGRKTQTRRVLKPQPDFRGGAGDYHDAEEWGWEDEDGYHVSVLDIAPNGYRRCDRLYVREAHALVPATAYRMSKGVTQAVDPSDRDRACVYREGWERCAPRWRPSIHMPRWASRLTLTVTDVRVQRLQDISEADAVAEGVIHDSFGGWRGHEGTIGYPTAIWAYHHLWNSLHGPGAWDANPWVVAVTFTVQCGNIDQIGDANG